MDIGEIKQGMILKEDLFSPFGDLLLTRGTLLNSKQVSFLKKWNLKELGVFEVEKNKNKSEDSQIVLALSMIDGKFADYDNDTSMMKLKQILKKFMLGSLAGKS